METNRVTSKMNKNRTWMVLVAVIGIGVVFATFFLSGFELLQTVRPSPQKALEITVWLLLTALFIVSRKRGAEAVRLREKMLKGQQLELAFQEQALNEHSMVVTTDTEGMVVSLNKNFSEMLGLSQDELLETDYRCRLNSNQGSAFKHIMQKTRAGEIWTGDIQLLKKNGSVAILRSTVVPMSDRNGTHTKTVFISTDVTKERITEEERNLVRCLELLPEDVYMFDIKSLKTLFMNEPAMRRIGWSKATYRTRVFSEISADFDENLLRECADQIEGGSANGARFETECRGVSMEAILQVVETTDLKKRLVMVLRDISERKATEETHRNLTSMVTHELRTPLTSIKGALQLLTAGTAGKVQPRVMSMLKIAESNSNRLLGLVDDILDLDKIAVGKMEFAFEPVDACQVVTEALQCYREYASGFGVEFKGNMTCGAAMIQGDYRRMLQVLANLMSNAAKFSNKGETVEISVSKIDGNVKISVTDTGPGIPEYARATLFEPFSQVASNTSSKVNGTGLGLTIVKAIVAHHGGSIDFHSVQGKGTTFFILLPELQNTQSEADIPIERAA